MHGRVPSTVDLSGRVLSERSAQDMDSAEGILSRWPARAAERLRLAREAAEAGPEPVARQLVESEQYAKLLWQVRKISPEEMQRVVGELGPVARRAVRYRE